MSKFIKMLEYISNKNPEQLPSDVVISEEMYKKTKKCKINVINIDINIDKYKLCISKKIYKYYKNYYLFEKKIKSKLEFSVKYKNDKNIIDIETYNNLYDIWYKNKNV